MSETFVETDGSIQTYTGARFYPGTPREADVHIEDIAHALSMQCRFTGHVRQFYSVAEHCVRVSQIVPDHARLWGLLHDASEAFLCDIARPVKQLPAFALYREMEARLEIVIFSRFGLRGDPPPEVKIADCVMLATEARDLMGVADPVRQWSLPQPPLAERIDPWTPEEAESCFLAAFRALHP